MVSPIGSGLVMNIAASPPVPNNAARCAPATSAAPSTCPNAPTAATAPQPANRKRGVPFVLGDLNVRNPDLRSVKISRQNAIRAAFAHAMMSQHGITAPSHRCGPPRTPRRRGLNMATLDKRCYPEEWMRWAISFIQHGLWLDYEIDVHGSHDRSGHMWGDAWATLDGTGENVPTIFFAKAAASMIQSTSAFLLAK